jgi:hypothetical protein
LNESEYMSGWWYGVNRYAITLYKKYDPPLLIKYLLHTNTGIIVT